MKHELNESENTNAVIAFSTLLFDVRHGAKHMNYTLRGYTPTTQILISTRLLGEINQLPKICVVHYGKIYFNSKYSLFY